MPAPLFTTNPAEFTRLEGLYVYETTPPGFIRGVSLGTAAVFGRCVRGPVDTPLEITSESRFLEVFGGRDYGAGGTLIGHIWRDLLNKPFGKLIVCRAADADATTTSFTHETAADGAGTAVLKIEASSPGAWSNGLVYWQVVDATDGNANHFNLMVKYLGKTTTYENLSIYSTDDNLLETLGDDEGNVVVLTKVAAGRPINSASVTETEFAAVRDSDGWVPLGLITGWTAVAGSDGTIAAADYTGTNRALDQVKAYRGVGIVWCAEDDATITPSVNWSAATARPPKQPAL